MLCEKNSLGIPLMPISLARAEAGFKDREFPDR